MSDRIILVLLSTIGVLCLVLLLDNVPTGMIPSSLNMTENRLDQARVVYVFGAVGAAMAIILFGFRSLEGTRGGLSDEDARGGS